MEGIRIKIDRNTRRALEFWRVGWAEPQPILLQNLDFEVGSGERWWDLACLKPPIQGVIIIGSQLANFLSAPIPRIEIRLKKRPAMMGKVIAGLKIDRIKG